MTRLVVCAAMGGARLLELRLSRRNLAAAGPTSEGDWTRRTYPLMVALHAAVIVGTALKGRRKASPFWLAVLLAVQPLRLWVLTALGERWNVRAAVPQAMPVETRGPYAYVRHPNYGVVTAELAALPLAFGLWPLALGATAVNAALLALRIPEEEALLAEVPGWQEHFADKARFIPGVM
ncbi:MAG: isoprenylcysteine carboxylmethyltransferase family protein [Tepidiformaceae bacterium]